MEDMSTSHVNNISKWLRHQESLIDAAQWLERPTGNWEAMGLIPVGDSDFSLSPCL